MSSSATAGWSTRRSGSCSSCPDRGVPAAHAQHRDHRVRTRTADGPWQLKRYNDSAHLAGLPPRRRGEQPGPADIVVVGAGSAGCVVAARSRRTRGRRVVLLEAGPDLPLRARPAGVGAASFFDAVGEPGLTWEALDVVRSSRQEPRHYVRGRGVGGSSAVNAMVAIPGEPGDYDTWETLGAAGWVVGRGRAVVREDGADTHVCPGRGTRPDRHRAAARLPGRDRTAFRSPATRTGLRVSAADAYLEPVRRSRPNLEIRCGTLVDRVRFHAGRVVGRAAGRRRGARRPSCRVGRRGDPQPGHPPPLRGRPPGGRCRARRTTWRSRSCCSTATVSRSPRMPSSSPASPGCRRATGRPICSCSRWNTSVPGARARDGDGRPDARALDRLDHLASDDPDDRSRPSSSAC